MRHCRPMIAAILLLVASVSAWCAAEPATRSADEVLAAFAIGHWGQSLTVPVEWGGKHACFLIDTGCTTNCIDPANFPALKPVDVDAKLVTAGGSRKARLFSPPDIHIGPISLASDGPVLAVDLSGVRSVTGEPVIGIIGDRALQKCVMQLDYDSSVLRFLKPGAQGRIWLGSSHCNVARYARLPGRPSEGCGRHAQRRNRHRAEHRDQPPHRSV